jgi:hypothetical protein
MSIEIKIGADISGVDTAINKVSTSLNNLKTPVKSANYALTSISQVTRDLPFGFIAIQNNLPLVVDSFGNLTREAGGVVPALKLIGSSLIGPAGISLAFSAVTSLITVAVQKYGSLGNVIQALVSNNGKLYESQQLYNKELAQSTADQQTESIKINILIKNLNDLKKPLADRYDAYVELKKISPDIVAGIKEENALTEKSIGIINANALARKELLLLKAKESAISAVINKNAVEQFSLELERTNLLKVQSKAQDEYNKTRKAGFDQSKNVIGGKKDVEAANLKTVNDLLAENKKQLNSLLKVQNVYANQLDPVISKISKIDGATRGLNIQLKNQDKLTKEQSKSDKEALRNGIEYANFLEERIALEEKLEIQRLKGIRTLSIQVGKDTKENLIKYGRLQTKDQPLQFFDITSFQDAFDKFIQNINSKPLKPTVDFVLPPIVDTPAVIKARKEIANLYRPEDFTKLYDAFSNGFFNPIQDLFDNFIQTGKLAFNDFGKAVLQAISQIVAKVIATGIITLLASIFTGGLGAGGAVSKAGGFGKILLGALGFGSVANPSFGGVNPSGMAMNGSVNLVLRGQDLVGSLNRTNSQFSRIG